MLRLYRISLENARLDLAKIGSGALQLNYLRIYATPDAWQTYRGFTALGCTFMIRLPAWLENRFLGGRKQRKPWGE